MNKKINFLQLLSISLLVLFIFNTSNSMSDITKYILSKKIINLTDEEYKEKIYDELFLNGSWSILFGFIEAYKIASLGNTDEQLINSSSKISKIMNGILGYLYFPVDTINMIPVVLSEPSKLPLSILASVPKVASLYFFNKDQKRYENALKIAKTNQNFKDHFNKIQKIQFIHLILNKLIPFILIYKLSRSNSEIKNCNYIPQFESKDDILTITALLFLMHDFSEMIRKYNFYKAESVAINY